MQRERRNKGVDSAYGTQSWRELAGGGKKRRMVSAEARKRKTRRVLRGVAVLIVLVGIGAIGLWFFTRASDEQASMQLAAPSRPVERIVFRTNGVLPDEWLGSVLDLQPGVTMMEADIHQLKRRIEAQGQVKSASVERRFPGDLVVEVVEHVPVFRLAVANRSGERRIRVVSRDGSVYDGLGYPESATARLPFLDPYRPKRGSILPLSGIDRVAALVELARHNYPQLFRTWRVVSLRNYSGDPEMPGEIIEIRSSQVPTIIFSAGKDFSRQLDRLAYILSYVRNRGNPSLKSIDLSLQGAAAVRFSSGRIGTF